jgi:hypothetical protein
VILATLGRGSLLRTSAFSVGALQRECEMSTSPPEVDPRTLPAESVNSLSPVSATVTAARQLSIALSPLAEKQLTEEARRELNAVLSEYYSHIFHLARPMASKEQTSDEPIVVEAKHIRRALRQSAPTGRVSVWRWVLRAAEHACVAFAAFFLHSMVASDAHIRRDAAVTIACLTLLLLVIVAETNNE